MNLSKLNGISNHDIYLLLLHSYAEDRIRIALESSGDNERQLTYWESISREAEEKIEKKIKDIFPD